MSDRSDKWAILRGKVPKVQPWTRHPDASKADRDFFDRLRAEKGTSSAVRLWRDFLGLMDCVQAIPGGETEAGALNPDQEADIAILREQAESELKTFAKRMEFRSPEEAREFWATFELWRTVAGGSARRSFVKAARLRSR